ncbi:MAG TPA: beta-propeller domain-containing protein [Longimicrobium sp.]|nr:beta-propeller domain-containing protein [Longimicrobium sp.]
MTRPLLLLSAAIAAHALSGCAGARTGPARPPPVASDGDTMRAFSGEAELAELLVRLREEGKREYDRVHANDPPTGPIVDHFYYPPLPPPLPAGVPLQTSATPPPGGSGTIESSPPPPTPSTAPAPGAPPTGAAPRAGGSLPPPVSLPAPAPGRAAPVQGGAPANGTAPGAAVPGVDEGGIVKAAGDYLVVLHRGRLFTVRIGGGALEPVSAVDAFGPGAPPGSYTYDRLLVSGDRVVVLGSAFTGFDDRVHVGVFHLAPDGRLAHRGTYGVRSVDPYGRYYHKEQADAVRLVGDRLVIYVPLDVDARNPLAGFPAVSGPGAASTPASDVRVYRPAGRVSWLSLHLHALTTCDLADGPPRCRSIALLAGGDRPFHVTSTAVYVWATQQEWDETLPERSVLYRMPLDGSAPTALHVAGRPVDGSSFLERDGHLHVLVRRGAPGTPANAGYALLRVPVSALGSGRDTAAAAYYRPLAGTWGPFQHRFVGDWLVYGITDSPMGGASTVHAVRLAGGGESRVVLPYRLERVEAMDPDAAAVVGSDGRGQHLAVVRLGPAGTALADQRSLGPVRLRPGFQYRPDGDGSGVLALPLYGPDRPGHEYLRLGSAGVRFLRSRDGRLADMGELASGEPTGDDACVSSCGLWYGNARALFLRGRVLALLGYELVEGMEEGGAIRELRRVGFAPR